MRVLAGAVIALAAIALAFGPAAAQDDYVNARFGYSICVPEGFAAQGEAENGDGQMFLAEGASLRVYGGHDALDQGLSGMRASALERLGPASYDKTGRDWFVISGRGGAQIYYMRAATRNGVFAAFEFTYPKALVERWNPVAAQLSRCFKGP